MEKPTPKELSEAAGISQSYASMILNDDAAPANRRTPARSLAIFMFRQFGWRHPSIAELTAEEMDVLERVEPWVRAQVRAA